MKVYFTSLLLLLPVCFFTMVGDPQVAPTSRHPFNALGDTLTVIQQPILNIPAIHIPGETLTITCIAPQNTTNFAAALLHGSKRINLPVLSSTWATSPNLWTITATIPTVQVYEHYDLEVSASGGIHDVTQNAVHIVPSRKQSYYFIHITDLHLPNRLYYPNNGYQTDSTSVLDFRSVIEDINLIRPEFVLLTGDLINEGELENFANQFWYGWAQRLIAQIEVPVYITSGNHDIGGWNSTPAPQGSARRNWWRYFGWSWLYNTDANWSPHTQDYYFTYNNTLYIGMEAYNNYDNWLSYIYGSDSFTTQQMAWLSNVISLHPGYTKAIFHHYDFTEDQLNLNALGINLSLKGHTHYNSGSIYNQPYNLITRSVCDENRAYRIIKVNNNQFTPTYSVYAGTDGAGFHVNYFPSNSGIADSVSATITNNQYIGFDNTLIKFIMPSGNTGYTVTNGVLEQVDRSGANNVCYVRVNMPANNVYHVSIKATGVDNDDELAVPPALSPLLIKSCNPNPVHGSAELGIFSDKQRQYAILELYNLKGQKVQELALSILNKGDNNISFHPLPYLANGIYFLKLKDTPAKPYKFIILK